MTFSRRSSTCGPEPVVVEERLELQGVFGVPVGDGEDQDLDGRQPQREGAVVVLDEDPEEPLERAEQGPVDHIRAVLLAVLADVGHVEPFGIVEVELDGGALPEPADGVLDLDVDLGAVKDRLAFLPFVAPGRGSRAP